MVVLRDTYNDKIVKQYPTMNFRDFIKNVWGGWFPFLMDGKIYTFNEKHQGCEDYSKYWAEK